MQNFTDYYRHQYMNEVRLPLMKNILRYCLTEGETGAYKEYAVELNPENNTIKILLTPTHMGDRAWITLAGSIEAEPQLHEEMDTEDLTYYTMYRMTPIEGRYHRDYHYCEQEATEADKILTSKELKDPTLIEMLNKALQEGFYFEATDKFTGRKEVVHQFVIPKEFAEYDVDEDEDE